MVRQIGNELPGHDIVKQMSTTLRNVLIAPLVILIRVPVASVLNVFIWLGAQAEKLSSVLNPYLPGFNR